MPPSISTAIANSRSQLKIILDGSSSPSQAKLWSEGATIGGDHRHRPLRWSGRGLHPAVLEPSNGPEFVGGLRLGLGSHDDERTVRGPPQTCMTITNNDDGQPPVWALFRPLGSEGQCLGLASCIHLVAILHFFPHPMSPCQSRPWRFLSHPLATTCKSHDRFSSLAGLFACNVFVKNARMLQPCRIALVMQNTKVLFFDTIYTSKISSRQLLMLHWYNSCLIYYLVVHMHTTSMFSDHGVCADHLSTKLYFPIKILVNRLKS